MSFPPRLLVRWAVVAAAVTLPSCAFLGRGGPRPPPAEVVLDGIVYRAATNFRTTGPVRIVTVVTAVNTRRNEAEIEVDTCPAVVRVYRTDRLIGLPVWDEEPLVAPTVAQSCAILKRVVVLKPGKPRSLTTAVVEPAVLGVRLEGGRYYFVTTMWARGKRIELASGHDDLRR